MLTKCKICKKKLRKNNKNKLCSYHYNLKWRRDDKQEQRT